MTEVARPRGEGRTCGDDGGGGGGEAALGLTERAELAETTEVVEVVRPPSASRRGQSLRR